MIVRTETSQNFIMLKVKHMKLFMMQN